ncbi:MAG: family 78 glycoside hydrolase catalytic domain [Clostridia bacterium]|nr:family 78 glycoside hydrolase catalytic domain [Clostridia bacterium]
MKKTIALIVSLIMILNGFPFSVSAQSDFSVTGLKVNYDDNPVLADCENISFSWQMICDKTGARQTAYRLRVYSFDRINNKTGELLSDTGKVQNDKSVCIRCESELYPDEKYAWCVTVWNENGVAVTSDTAYFETAPNDDFFEEVKWISGNDNTSVLRGKFTAEKEIAYAKVYASSIGVFDLFINGERVGEATAEGTLFDEMKPGWSDYTKRILYYAYDITPYLNSCDINGFSAMLSNGWALGRISKGHYGFEKTAFIMKAHIIYTDSTDTWFTTSSDWKYSDDSAVTESDIYDGETYNANLYDGFEVSRSDFDDSDWEHADDSISYPGEITPHTGVSARVRNDLERSAEKITIYEGIKDNGSDFGEIDIISECKNFSEFTLKKGQTAIFDLGQNITGWQKISFIADKNTEIIFDYAEMLNDSGLLSRKNDGPEGTLYTENYRSAKADSKYIARGDGTETCFGRSTFYGFRYVSVTADRDITITDFKGQVVTSIEKESGSIETSDESINKLFSNILWSQRGNYLSIPTDCPQRDEKLGWTGDAQIFIGAASYNADVKTFMDKWLRDLRDSQGTDGRYTDIVPYIPIVGKGNAAWGDAGIIIPYNLYLMYGDSRIIEKMYDSMEKYMAHLATRGYKGANVTYGDWLSYEDNSTPVRELIAAAYYAYDAILMAEMSEVTGRREKAEHYRDLYKQIRKYFRDTFIEKCDLKSSLLTQTCYLMALKTGMYEGEKEKLNMLYSLCSNITANGNKLATGFVGTADINEILTDYGKSNLAYTLILQRENPSWLCSVEQGATTVWERWNSYTEENGFYEPSMNSYNHYSYGAVAEWMYSDMLGINADKNSPGFKNIIFRFNPDMRQESEIPSNERLMTYSSGEYAGAYGNIKSKWENTGNGFKYDITVPANSTATVYIPVSHSDLYFGSVKVTDIGMTSNGVTYLGIENGFAEFETVSGSFTFETKKRSDFSHSFNETVFPASCTEEGFTFYECECSYSYYGQKLDITNHIDSNSDGKCDICSVVTDTTVLCDHLCHKSGFSGLLWKIIRFFWKFFKINPQCECGANHY